MSRDFTDSSLKKLFELTPGAHDLATQTRCDHFIAEGGSVFELLKMGRQGVVETFGLHSCDAQVLLDKAMSLAV